MFLGQEVHYYMIYIAYFTELNLKICDYAQKQRICRENCKYALDENFHDHFCSRRKAAKFCHPGIAYFGLNYLHFTLSLEIFSLWKSLFAERRVLPLMVLTCSSVYFGIAGVIYYQVWCTLNGKWHFQLTSTHELSIIHYTGKLLCKKNGFFLMFDSCSLPEE